MPPGVNRPVSPAFQRQVGLAPVNGTGCPQQQRPDREQGACELGSQTQQKDISHSGNHIREAPGADNCAVCRNKEQSGLTGTGAA